jgi:phosphatidylserine/phosphatidylglycerophosphate/cardiolipin synthase-like enzyme
MRSMAELDQYRPGGFPQEYPHSVRTFYAPTDDVHGALLHLIRSADRTLQVAMYAINDIELADAVLAKAANPKIRVQITLDVTQAAGVTEAALLAAVNFPATSLAIGRSERGQAMHLKEVVVDGRDTAGGSTNWSAVGEARQDNQLIVIRNRAVAAQASGRLDAIHAHILSRS